MCLIVNIPFDQLKVHSGKADFGLKLRVVVKNWWNHTSIASICFLAVRRDNFLFYHYCGFNIKLCLYARGSGSRTFVQLATITVLCLKFMQAL